MTTCDTNPTKLLIILITFLFFNNIIAKKEWISDATTNQTGKRWALLIAGSYGYDNYRHQVPFLCPSITQLHNFDEAATMWLAIQKLKQFSLASVSVSDTLPHIKRHLLE